MAGLIFWQWLTLSVFAAFMGFCFCDGFNLHILRKLVWFAAFLALVILSMKIRNEFNLNIILTPSVILAILFCVYEKKRQREKK